MRQKIKQFPCPGGAVSHHGLPPDTGALDLICTATHPLSACQPAPSPRSSKPWSYRRPKSSTEALGLVLTISSGSPRQREQPWPWGRPWQTNPPHVVLQILLASGFGFQQKRENKVSKEKKQNAPKEGKRSILNKIDEKNRTT